MADDGVVYPRAPITEAILHIGIVPAVDCHADSLQGMTERLKEEYPQINKVYDATGQLMVGQEAGASATLNQVHSGYNCRTEANTRAYVARIDGLAVSTFRPYDQWRDHKARAQRLWLMYRETSRPVAISRIGLRYINRIDLPRPQPARAVQLEEYFQTRVEISSALPSSSGTISNFFFQAQLPQTDIGAYCILNSAGLPPASDEVISFLLDIDMFRATEIPQKEADVWTAFDVLRARKNLIFEACITDRCRELFK